jgi:hypothetical protein
MTIDERIQALVERHEALTMSLELLTADVHQLRDTARQDGDNIRALARIAEIHERRLSALEGADDNGSKPE